MARLNYDRGKLLKAAAFGAVVALICIYALMNPEDFGSTRKSRWITSDFGRLFLLPSFVTAGLAIVWRSASLAMGDLMAIEFTPTHLKLNGLWGLKTVRWQDVDSAMIESNMNHPQLCVRTRTGGLFGAKKIRLPIGLTEVQPHQLHDLLAAIEHGGRSAPAAAASPASSDVMPSAFDPDAAIARYLAQKGQDDASGAQLAAAPGSPLGHKRPTFGRKQN